MSAPIPRAPPGAPGSYAAVPLPPSLPSLGPTAGIPGVSGFIQAPPNASLSSAPNLDPNNASLTSSTTHPANSSASTAPYMQQSMGVEQHQHQHQHQHQQQGRAGRLGIPPCPPPLPPPMPAQKAVFLFRHRIQPGGLYKPDPKRYILYVSDACPWSCRCLAYWALKHLNQVIQIGMAAPIWKFCPLHEAEQQQRRMAEQQQRAQTAGNPPSAPQRLGPGAGMTTSVHLQHSRPTSSSSPGSSGGLRHPAFQPGDYGYLQQACPAVCGSGACPPLAVTPAGCSAPCTCGWVFDPPRGFNDPLGRFATVADIYLHSMTTTGDTCTPSLSDMGVNGAGSGNQGGAGRPVSMGMNAELGGGYRPTSSSTAAVSASGTNAASHGGFPLSRTAYTLPILYDTHTNTIVNNSSSDICQALNDMFNEVAKAPEVNLTPRALQSVIRDMNKRLVTPIAVSILECGRATMQVQYEREANGLFNRLDEQRYLCSPGALTDSDIRLCTTLVRFDDVYTMCCRCNRKLIRVDYPHILEWLRDVVQTANILPIVANMASIKAHYFLSPMNPIGPAGGFRIVPQGSNFERLLMLPHHRNSEGTALPTMNSGGPFSSGDGSPCAGSPGGTSGKRGSGVVNKLNISDDDLTMDG
eukprot:gene259-133_t